VPREGGASRFIPAGKNLTGFFMKLRGIRKEKPKELGHRLARREIF